LLALSIFVSGYVIYQILRELFTGNI
jgi:hypothetical protein